MASQVIDYAAVLLDLENKRTAMNARFDAAIAAIRQVLTLERGEQQPRLPSLQVPPPPVVPGAGSDDGKSNGPYQGMGLAEAGLAHLERSGGGPIPNVVLARALEAGGLQHKSKSFPNTLNSVLRRYALNKGGLMKVAKGWVILVPSDHIEP